MVGFFGPSEAGHEHLGEADIFGPGDGGVLILS